MCILLLKHTNDVLLVSNMNLHIPIFPIANDFFFFFLIFNFNFNFNFIFIFMIIQQCGVLVDLHIIYLGK